MLKKLDVILNEYGKGAINSASCYLNSDIKILLNLIERQEKRNKDIEQNYISKSMLKEIKKTYKQQIEKAHPASDIVFIDWLEDRIKFIDDLLEENRIMEEKKYKEIRYMMKKGDCICKVCKQFGLEVSEVLKLNNIENITDIKAGDYIVLLKEEIKDGND